MRNLLNLAMIALVFGPITLAYSFGQLATYTPSGSTVDVQETYSYPDFRNSVHKQAKDDVNQQ